MSPARRPELSVRRRAASERDRPRQELGTDFGPVVVVVVGYNDYEANYAANIDDAMAVFRKAGVQHVLWATLRAGRQSYVDMNRTLILAAAKKYPEITVLDWDGLAQNQPDWLQPDGIHLTPEGAEGMAAMIESALVQLVVAPKAPPPSSRRLLAIASRILPPAREGRRYAVSLKAIGGTAPYRWARTAGSLSPGLRLTATGTLAGIPAKRARSGCACASSTGQAPPARGSSRCASSPSGPRGRPGPRREVDQFLERAREWAMLGRRSRHARRR